MRSKKAETIVVCAILQLVASVAVMQAQAVRPPWAARLAAQPIAYTTAAPPTDSYCRMTFGFPCYSPQEMQQAYGLTPLLEAGYNGAGQTIVIIDSFGSPTIEQDLKVLSARATLQVRLHDVNAVDGEGVRNDHSAARSKRQSLDVLELLTRGRANPSAYVPQSRRIV